MSMMSAAKPLCPDKRGGRRCMCHGTFLSMKHGSGWIRPMQEINHPSAQWNQGDIYLSEKDVVLGVTLEPGDSVVFYLYVDAKGLGAERCGRHWREEAQALQTLPSVTEIAVASAYLAASAMLKAPVVAAPPGLTNNNVAVDLSCFYDDDDDEEESDADDSIELYSAKPTEIRLADILVCDVPETRDPPSMGSALHKEGTCKRCSFFPKGTCTNGAACEFCHFDHDKQPKNRRRKHAKAIKPAVLRTPLQEPMKCAISSYLMSSSKDLFSTGPGCNNLHKGNRTPTTCTDELSADEGNAPRTPTHDPSSADEGNADASCIGSDCDTPPIVEREPCSPDGKMMPPSGRTPPPSFPPPPMPEYMSAEVR